MKQHLVMHTEPLEFRLSPPVMFGLCGAPVYRPTPAGEPFEVGTQIHGEILPEMNSLQECPKCRKELVRRLGCNEDEWGNLLPRDTRWYLYWIAPAEEVEDEQHRGTTILECEEAVKKAEGK